MHVEGDASQPSSLFQQQTPDVGARPPRVHSCRQQLPRPATEPAVARGGPLRVSSNCDADNEDVHKQSGACDRGELNYFKADWKVGFSAKNALFL